MYKRQVIDESKDGYPELEERKDFILTVLTQEEAVSYTHLDVYKRQEYHIDGFRFDLMGVLDIETLNEARKALLKINPDIICLLYTSRCV